jgi:anthranilate phosphoribosyltransferase
MKEILNKLFNYQSLERAEAREILTQMASGTYNTSQMAAFVTVYLMRHITVEELSGFRDAMLELCVKVPLDNHNAIDVCGTGGDGKDTFNISTISSFIIAGAGQSVAKHGNYGVSSVCGSSNVLEYLGCTFTNNQDILRKSIDESGICFMHAPLFHPAMKNVAPVRKELGIKTFFNMLGPMVNPAIPESQFVGVFNLELARLYGYIYQETDQRFMIVHALDGYDEVSLTGNLKYISNESEGLLSPGDLGFSSLNPSDLAGGSTIKEAADIFTAILENKGTTSQTHAVLANAGLALATAKSISHLEGIDLAKESIESGSALKSFKKFIEINRS